MSEFSNENVYIFYGGIDPQASVILSTSLSDRATVSALDRMGLRVLADLGIEVIDVYGSIGVVVGKASKRELKELSKYGIRYERDIVVKALTNPSLPPQWSLKLIGADKVQEMGYSGKGVKIAIIDSGVDGKACGLENKVVYSKSYVPFEDANDYNGHGTHVASIAASSDDNYRGVAPGASIMNFKAINKNGIGYGFIIARAIIDASKNGADIINLSLGGYPAHKDDFLSRIVNLAVANGSVVVAAAGNEGPCNGNKGIATPGSASLAITVGAVDRNKHVTCYSSRGPIDDLLKPEVVAPGGVHDGKIDDTIIASRPKGPKSLCPAVGECYMGCVGTSMAAPHVAGAAALILEAMGKETATQMKPISVKAAIVNSAENLGEDKYAQGYGLVRVDNAIRSIRSLANAQQVQQSASSIDVLISALPVAILFGGLMSVISNITSRSSDMSKDSLLSLIRYMFKSGRITLNDLYNLKARGLLTDDDLRRIIS